MNIGQFLLMRHEMVLVLLALVILILELAIKDDKKHVIIPVSIVLFLITLIVGFLPVESATLFGGSYNTGPLVATMKNVLNIGVFIVFLQSAIWL
jgi:NADH-quinone oxidoreductase subunit N